MRYRGMILVVLALLLAACAGGLTDEGGVSGTWTGQLTQGSVPLTLTLTQTSTTVTGDLRVNNDTAIPLTGTAVSNPESNGVLVSLSGGGAQNSVRIEASAEGSAMRGRLVTTGANAADLGFTATR